MNFERIPTPETDLEEFPEAITKTMVTESYVTRDLERRLTVAREALSKINNSCLTMEQAENVADKAITQTAPKT